MRALMVPALLLAMAVGASQLPHGRTADSYGPGRQLAHCTSEDGSSGPLPCMWDASHDGNGRGASFWLDSTGTAHPIR